MKKKIKNWLKKKYYQFIKGECPHICLFCEFRKDCTIVEENEDTKHRYYIDFL